MKVNDIVLYKPNSRKMRVLEVGFSPDNNGKKRPAVRCAALDELRKEAKGEYDPDWGAPIKFKASRYWYLLSEVSPA